MPRTQTNDPTVWPGQYPVRLWTFKNVPVNQVLTFNARQGSTLVVVSMDVVNTAGGSGETCALAVGPPPLTAIFGGMTGAGAFDTFSWRGMLPLFFGDTITVLAAVGLWDTVGAGYYVPAVLTT